MLRKEQPFPLCGTLPRIRVNPEPEPMVVLLAPVTTSAQLGLESRLASRVIDHLLLLPVPNLDRPVNVVPSVVVEVRLAVLELADGFAPFDARVDDGRVAPADIGTGLAALVAFERFGLGPTGLFPVGAEPEGFGRLDRLASCFSAGRVDVGLHFLGGVAGIAETVE